MPLVELSDITKIYHLGGERILDLFRRFHREGRTIILVPHDPEIAAVTPRKIEIRDGKIAQNPDRRLAGRDREIALAAPL